MKLRTFAKTGTNYGGFFASGLGSFTMPITFAGWFRFGDCVTGTSSSRLIFKYGANATYGGSNDGFGFGVVWNFGGGAITDTGLCYLVEGLEWRKVATRDDSWHHLAVIGKLGSSPVTNAVYIDGVNRYTASSPYAMSSPSDVFSLLGRPNADGYDIDAFVCRPVIYNGILSATEILNDMSMGADIIREKALHFWDGSVNASGKAVDVIGDWHLTPSAGCFITDELPQVLT